MAHPASTNRKTRFSWHRAPVSVLTLGQDYFRPNSGAFFPAALVEGDNADAWKRAALEANGLRSLAALFKQLELDNRKRVVVAGYADAGDDSGGVPDRFELSALRARAVLSLLRGGRTEFAAACHEKHTVEDYQRVLKYLALSWQLYLGPGLTRYDPCDPGAINGQWGEATENATRNLILNHNRFEKTIGLDHSVPITGVLRAIRADDRKRWPMTMWAGVYNLFERALGSMIGVSRNQLNQRRRNLLKFCDTNRRFVTCGESFPLDGLGDEGKSKYTPKPGRGVEIILFNETDIPGKRINRIMRIVCPTDQAAVHPARLCPIFYKHHLAATYFDHTDLEIAKYYLKFAFFNAVTGSVADVPAGLPLKAYYLTVGGREREIDCAVEFADGLYTVTVPDDPQRQNIYFGFKTVDRLHPTQLRWVYTADENTAPIIVTKTAAEIAALESENRRKYYDLPAEWSSRNYYARYGGHTAAGDRFEPLMTAKGIKPHGADKQAADKPLVFSLDDIVLVDGNGRQTIRDQDETGTAQDLSEHSRVTLLYLDEKDKGKVKIHKPIEAEPFFSDVAGGFQKNLIHDCWLDQMGKFHSRCRAVVFCSQFYDVYDKRTGRAVGFDFATGHILGARAAMLNDPDASYTRFFSGAVNADATADYLMPGSGRYDLTYLHDAGFVDGKMHSALIRYWSCRFTVDAGRGGLVEDKTNFTKYGMKNAMDRYALKDYQLEKHTGNADIVIKTFALFEAKQDYTVGPDTFKRGGRHRCLITLVSDDHGSSIGGETAKFRHSAYKAEPDRFPATHDDYGGGRPPCLTVAHELGHGSGIKDDYLYNQSDVTLPRYVHPTNAAWDAQYYPGMPYDTDLMSLMNENHALRLRHYWGFVNWINDEGRAAQVAPNPVRAAGAMHKFLDDTKFKIVYHVPPRPGHPPDLSFQLVNDNYRNPYKPAYSNDNFAFAADCRAGMYLYKAGDEFSRLITANQAYDGILMITPKIFVRFIDGGVADAQMWLGSWTRARQWIQALDSDLRTMLNRYRLQCTVANNDFANTYVKFLPHYQPRKGAGGAAPAGTHFTLEVTRDGTDTIAVAGTTITVGSGVANKKIIRHMFGQSRTDANLTIAEMDPIKTWVGHADRANGTFNLIAL